MTYTPEETETVTSRIADGIGLLVTMSGANSAAHGFHDDWPEVTITKNGIIPSHRRALGLAITEKLALIHEEISEALGEIRSGYTPGEVYYRDTKGVFGEFDATFDEQRYTEDGTPILKPEGFGMELADAMIRIADTSHLTGIDLPALVLEKARYNATRPYKHGRQF